MGVVPVKKSLYFFPLHCLRLSTQLDGVHESRLHDFSLRYLLLFEDHNSLNPAGHRSVPISSLIFLLNPAGEIIMPYPPLLKFISIENVSWSSWVLHASSHESLLSGIQYGMHVLHSSYQLDFLHVGSCNGFGGFSKGLVLQSLKLFLELYLPPPFKLRAS